MSEEKGAYLSGVGNGERTIVCARCGQELGRMVDLKGQKWLLLGGVIVVRNAFGACGKCGEEFHWSVADRMLAELIRSVLDTRNHAKNTMKS